MLCDTPHRDRGGIEPPAQASRTVDIGTPATDHEIASIDQLTNLEGLSLDAENAGPETMAAIARLTKLEGLCLVDVTMTDADVRRLRALKNLRRLQILYRDGPPDSPTNAALASLWDDLPELTITGPRSSMPATKGQPLNFQYGR